MSSTSARTECDVTALFHSEAPAIFGYLLLRCGSRAVAEELTSETFLAASRMASNERIGEVTPAWLHTVAKRRLIDHWRSSFADRRRLHRLAQERVPASTPSDGSDGRVEAALDSLPSRQRAVLVLRYLDDFSVSEVAEALGLGYKATESLLTRARRSFAAAYGDDDASR